MTKTKDPIGLEIKELRKLRKQSVPKLAIILGVPKDRIYKWEAGSAPKYADRQLIGKWKADPNWKNVPRDRIYTDTPGVDDYANVMEPKNIEPLLLQLMKQQNQLMSLQNQILQEQKEEIKDRIIQIDSNLKSVAGKAESLQYDLISGREAVLKSLARLEHLPNENQLLTEADRRKKFLAESKTEHYSKAAGGSQSI